MITDNTKKKELIQKLLDDKKVTMDEAFMLLDEPQPYSSPSVPIIYPQTYPVYPYQGPWWGVYPPADGWRVTCGDLPGTCTITCNSLDTSATIVGNGTTCNYTTIEEGLRIGRISYTSSVN